MNMNDITIVGRATKDFEVREVGGKKVANGTVAVGRPYKDKDGKYPTDFFDIEAWNSAEYCGKCVKGQEISINGSMEQRNYTDKEGKRRTSWTLKATRVTLGSLPGEGNAAANVEDDDADFPPF